MTVTGIIAIKNKKIITGEFEKTHNTIQICSRNGDSADFAKHYDIVKDDVFFSTFTGRYYWKKQFEPFEIFQHTHVKGIGLYPYSFPREYEAVQHVPLFKGLQKCKYDYNFIGADEIPYTFGIEFETSSGCIPEPICFRDGLIPLRDGSINGPEYSTIVLKGNEGVNMLYQQLETLRKYTHFNKECALHMHLGGFPVDRKFIFTLYSLCVHLESDFIRMTNRDVFNTARYKTTGKNYCNALEEFETFPAMFEYLVGTRFTGSLQNAHPDDMDRNQKWHIHSRYKCVNFINMLCYRSPKTVEFRFLRPTYNFTKVYTWLLLFTAILKFAESFTKRFGECSYSDIADKAYKAKIDYDIRSICKAVYPSTLANYLDDRITELQTVALLQQNNEDYAGNDTTFEDELMTASFK